MIPSTGRMMKGVYNDLQQRPPLKKRKNPYVAAVLGLLFGPIGLGCYLQDWKDVWLPALMTVLLGLSIPVFGVPVAWVFSGMYGFVRVSASRATRAAGKTAEQGFAGCMKPAVNDPPNGPQSGPFLVGGYEVRLSIGFNPIFCYYAL